MDNFASLDTLGGPGAVKVVEWNQNQLIRSLCFQPRAATATKTSKAWALPKFWVSIYNFYKKQPVKKIRGRILGLVWLKFAVAALQLQYAHLLCFMFLFQ